MTRQPDVVVDARMATDGGIGTYLQALVPRVTRARPEWAFSLLGDRERMQGLGWDDLPNARLVDCTPAIFSAREQVQLPLRVNGRATAYWAPNYNVPALLRAALAVTIHDVNHLVLPELMGGSMRARYARWLLTSTVRRARRVLFVSEFTQRETERVLHRACKHGRVIHSGVDSSWREARADGERPLAAPYFLYVGNIKRHKNVPFLLRAFERLRDAVPHRLVLIGRVRGLRADPAVVPGLERMGDRVTMLGEVPAAVLRRYVAHADALVSASLYEGFGLPPLEAMAAGTPCLVANAGAFPEVCGDAAMYADPRDEAAFASEMLRLARDPSVREDLARRGRVRARQFDWDRSARLTVEVLEDVVRSAPAR